MRDLAAHTLLDGFERLIVDLDGVVNRGDAAIPGAVEALAQARSRGSSVIFLTNNSSRSQAEVAHRLAGFGIDATPLDVMTSAVATVGEMRSQLRAGEKVLVLGTDALRAEVRQSGLVPVASADESPRAVLLGFSVSASWSELAEASIAIGRGAMFYATNVDASAPSERGLVPANGALAGVVTAVTGVAPISMGKPDPAIYKRVMGDIDPHRILAVGDRLDTDIKGAGSAGIVTLHVLSGAHGVTELIDADTTERPDYIGLDLRALHRPLAKAHVAGDTWACGEAIAVVKGAQLELSGPRSLNMLRAAVSAAWESADRGNPLDADSRAELRGLEKAIALDKAIQV
jgi:glycerol-1-phosphatase